MSEVFICDYVRTPIGRYGGSLAAIRPDDLCAVPIAEIIRRNDIDCSTIDDVVMGCANQAGEDNRNVARMALLLARLPETVPGITVNRLCGSGMDAVLSASRMIASGDADLVIAGGVESMSRAPFVMPKSDRQWSRDTTIYDTTMGWRFVNPVMHSLYGTDSMPETAENVAEQYRVTREDQDAFALRSHQRATRAISEGRMARETTPVRIEKKNRETIVITEDEQPRSTSLKALAALPTPFRDSGTVTAGNASSLNDGAAALLIASQHAVDEMQLEPMVSILGGAVVGVQPEIMGIGPIDATKKLLSRAKISIDEFDCIEINEAFASQALACMRGLGLADDDERVNPNGGAIALGHPLGMSGARITGTAALDLQSRNGYCALATMCIGVGQGIAIALKAV